MSPTASTPPPHNLFFHVPSPPPPPRSLAPLSPCGHPGRRNNCISRRGVARPARPVCVKPLEGREGGARSRETAAAPAWASSAAASPAEGAAAGGAKGTGRGFLTHQAVGQVQPEPIPPPAAASDTGAAGAAGAIRTDVKSKGRALAIEVGVPGEGEVTLAGGFVVPSFCPSDPFTRYAALHRNIIEGNLEPRCGGTVSFRAISL